MKGSVHRAGQVTRSRAFLTSMTMHDGMDASSVDQAAGSYGRGIIDRDHRQADLLDRVHVVIIGPVGVLDDELATRSGHDIRSRFAAPQGTA